MSGGEWRPREGSVVVVEDAGGYRGLVTRVDMIGARCWLVAVDSRHSVYARELRRPSAAERRALAAAAERGALSVRP